MNKKKKNEEAQKGNLVDLKRNGKGKEEKKESKINTRRQSTH